MKNVFAATKPYRQKPRKPGLLATIQVAGESIDVYWVKDLKSPEGTKCDGLWKAYDHSIELDCCLADYYAWCVLAHEIAHAAASLYSLELENEEERVVDCISKGLIQGMQQWLPKKLLKKG